MYLYEPRPILGDGIDPDVDWVGVCRAKGDVHLAESLKTSSSCFLPSDALEAIVESDGDVEAFG